MAIGLTAEGRYRRAIATGSRPQEHDYHHQHVPQEIVKLLDLTTSPRRGLIHASPFDLPPTFPLARSSWRDTGIHCGTLGSRGSKGSYLYTTTEKPGAS
jgi:hypothetical protein